MEVANTQFSSDSQPWHQTQLVKVTESLPASHPDVGLPGCLIAAGPAKRFPLRCVFRPSQAFCSLCVQLVPQRELHVLAYSPGIQQVYTIVVTIIRLGLPRWLRQGRSHKFNPWVWKTPRGGNGKPLHYSCLENPMDRGAWWATVHGVAKSRT